MFLSDWWHLNTVRNNIFSQRYYTTGDGFAILLCVLSSVWALGKVIFVSKQGRLLRTNMPLLNEIEKANQKQIIQEE